MIRALLGLLLLGAALPARAADGPRIYAAGSLTGAFTAMIQAYGSGTAEFGPSGLLRSRIEAGEPADLLASADLGQPRKLAAAGKGGPVVLFVRNKLCALSHAALGLTPETLLDRLLDPALRLATSTPGADPGGDYAWIMFRRAGAARPGAQAALEAKAQKLVGGPNTPPLVAGYGQAEGVFLANRADVMLGYCSGIAGLQKTIPDLVATPLPPDLAVGAEYGLTVLNGSEAGAKFALFVLSDAGQTILARYGFSPVALPSE